MSNVRCKLVLPKCAKGMADIALTWLKTWNYSPGQAVQALLRSALEANSQFPASLKPTHWAWDSCYTNGCSKNVQVRQRCIRASHGSKKTLGHLA